MVSAKTMANGYQPSKGETWGKANLRPHTTNLFLPFFSTTKRVKMYSDDNLPPPSPRCLGIAPVANVCSCVLVFVCAFVQMCGVANMCSCHSVWSDTHKTNFPYRHSTNYVRRLELCQVLIVMSSSRVFVRLA